MAVEYAKREEEPVSEMMPRGVVVLFFFYVVTAPALYLLGWGSPHTIPDDGLQLGLPTALRVADTAGKWSEGTEGFLINCFTARFLGPYTTASHFHSHHLCRISE